MKSKPNSYGFKKTKIIHFFSKDYLYLEVDQEYSQNTLV